MLVEIGINSRINEINSIFNIDLRKLGKNTVIVFVISTTGSGNFPTSSKKFVKFLLKMIKLKNYVFSGLRYIVVGLGSSVYEYSYNLASIKLDKYLSLLGGKKYCEMAMLDEVSGNEECFCIWWNKTLLTALGMPSKEQIPKPLCNSIEVEDYKCILTNLGSECNNHSLSGNCPISEKYFRLIEFVSINKTLLCESTIFNDVKKQIFSLKLEFSDKNLSYETLDTIDILPQNPIDVILCFSSKVLGISNIETLDKTYIDFVPTDPRLTNFQVPFPPNKSLLHVLKYYFDLITLPPRNVISQFFPYLSKADEKLITDEKIFNLYRDDYKHSFSLFIEHFMGSLTPVPVEVFLKFNGIRQKFRSYSISSSSKVSPSTVDLTISTYIKGPITAKRFHLSEDDPKYDEYYFKGLCSSFLFELELGSNIFGIIRSPSFKIRMFTSPLLLFSHGSGISPIRAILQERRQLDITHYDKPTYLFYGCRTEDEVIYKEELEEFKNGGILTEVFFALSKSKGVRVGDIIATHKRIILEMLFNNETSIFMCGSRDFVSEIKRVVSSIIIETCPNDEIYRNMFREGRVIIESWG
ncbi:Flavodoxin family protein [Cryptosporidium felis]|nr:Flavodoxin family protein [Cryptosporidium felis]